MSIPTLNRVSPGHPLRISAADWNAITGATRLVRQRYGIIDGNSGHAGGGISAAVIRVRNVDSDPLVRGGHCVLTAPSILPTANEAQWWARILFDGRRAVEEDTDWGMVGVCAQPIEPGLVGRVVVAGVAHVDQLDGDGPWIRPATDGPGWVSAATGVGRVMWSDGPLGIVRLGVDVRPSVVLGRITAVDDSGLNAVYDAAAVDEPGLVIEDATPIDRPIAEPAVYEPREVDDYCELQVDRATNAVVGMKAFEVVDIHICGGSSPG